MDRRMEEPRHRLNFHLVTQTVNIKRKKKQLQSLTLQRLIFILGQTTKRCIFKSRSKIHIGASGKECRGIPVSLVRQILFVLRVDGNPGTRSFSTRGVRAPRCVEFDALSGPMRFRCVAYECTRACSKGPAGIYSATEEGRAEGGLGRCILSTG